MLIQKLVQYYRACYEADKGKNNLWNIFASDIEHLTFLDVTDGIPDSDQKSITLEPKYAKNLRASVNTYRREKKLLLCSLFIIARADTSNLGGMRRGVMCAPLIISDVSFAESESESITYERVNARWNYPLLYWLLDGRENTELFEEKISFDQDELPAQLWEYLQTTLACEIHQHSIHGKDDIEGLKKAIKSRQLLLCHLPSDPLMRVESLMNLFRSAADLNFPRR